MRKIYGIKNIYWADGSHPNWKNGLRRICVSDKDRGNLEEIPEDTLIAIYLTKVEGRPRDRAGKIIELVKITGDLEKNPVKEERWHWCRRCERVCYVSTPNLKSMDELQLGQPHRGSRVQKIDEEESERLWKYFKDSGEPV